MKNPFLYLVIGILFGVGVEIISHYLGFGEPVLAKLDDTIEYTVVENQKITRFGNRVQINKLGLRSKEVTLKKKPSEKRIILFGDSIVYGNHHIDQDETIVSNLDAILAKECGRTVFSVLSVAVSSWGPKNILEYIKKRGLYEGDVFFLVLSSHDIYDFPTFNSDLIPYRLEKSYGAAHDLFLTVYNRTERWIKSKFTKPKIVEDRSTLKFKTNKIINEIIDLVKKEGKGTIHFVFHPTERELSNNDLLSEKFYEKIAIQNKIQFINFRPKYKIFNSKNEEKIHFDGMHLSANGANFVARILTKEILNQTCIIPKE